MRRRVILVDPAAEDGNGEPARLECTAVGLAVHPTRQPAHDHEPGGSQRQAEHAATCAPYGEHACAPTTETARPARRSGLPAPRRYRAGEGVVDGPEAAGKRSV